MSPALDYKSSSRTQQFCMSVGDKGENYVVELEETINQQFIVRYGVHPELTTYPSRGQWLLKLEAIQFLGRLWGDDYKMPAQVKDAYIVWLRGIEKQFLHEA